MKKLLLAAIVLNLCATGYAEQWHISGPRALGMGGAFTAIADGPLAQQWNPAGLVSKNDKNDAGVLFGAGAFVSASKGLADAVQSANDAFDDIKELRDKMDANQIINVKDAAALGNTLKVVNELANGKQSVLVSAEAPFGFKIKILQYR